MNNKPDPKKAIYLKLNQRRLSGQRRSQQQEPAPQWEPHQNDCALDPWSTALRDMRRAGRWPE